MSTRITIKATRQDGVTMYWSEHGWSSHESDAKDFRTHEAAGQAAAWDQPFRGMIKQGWNVEIRSENE